jgi:heat shock protein HtpX
MGLLLVATGASLGGVIGGSGLLSSGGLIGAAVALGIWFVLWLITIGQGDSIMLSMANAKRIEKKDHPRLYNIVEEMTIASSLGMMPAVYIVDDPSPNAFATGRDKKRSAVAVTTGLLERLNRDELQGVVAHEIGPIKNRDVALMTTAGIMVGAIALLAEVGRRALWFGGGSRRSRSDNNQSQAILMAVSILLLILAPIIAQLVYFALSRRREYLADASGAYFTRYPDGLANALEKISASPSKLANQSAVTAPMYIASPMAAAAASATSTHPPMAERVRILRTMGGRADFGAYEAAYKKARHESAIGTQTLNKTEPVEARGPLGDWDEDPADRHRMASDAFLSASGYKTRTCSACGATLKAPPEALAKISECPRCKAPL